MLDRSCSISAEYRRSRGVINAPGYSSVGVWADQEQDLGDELL